MMNNRRTARKHRAPNQAPNPLGLSPAAARALRRISEEAEEAILEIERQLYHSAGHQALDELRAGVAQKCLALEEKRSGIAHLLDKEASK